MKKLFLILSFFISLISYGQTGNLTGNRVQANSNLLPPLDTILAPYRLGEIRTQVVAGVSYIFICRSLSADKKWDVYVNTSSPTNTRFSITKGLNDSLQLVNDELSPMIGYTYAVDVFDKLKKWEPSREEFYGEIYNGSNFVNTSGFTASGATVSVVNGNLQFTGGVGGFTQRLDLTSTNSAYTMLPYWRYYIRTQVGTKDGTSYGFGVGTASTNSFGLSNALGRFSMYTGAGTGTVIANTGTGNTQVGNTSGALTFSVGDSIELVSEVNLGVITISARNFTTKSTWVSSSYTYNGASPYMGNTGRFSIFSLGGTFSIDSINISSTTPKNALVAVVGDSKTQLYNADNQASSWGAILNSYYRSTIIHAGGFDRTSEALQRLPELIATNPQQVVLCIGSNDIRTGVDSATYCGNYDAFVTGLINAKRKVLHTTLMYESGINQMPLINHIRKQYPAADIIETYEKTRLATGFLSGDNVHPTPAGQKEFANIVLQSNKIWGGNIASAGTVTYAGIGTVNSLQKLAAPSVLTNSNVSDDGTTVTVNSPFRASTTSTYGNRTEGTVQATFNVAPDGNVETYSFGGIAHLQAINNARNAGYPLRIGGSYSTLGWLGTLATYNESVRASSTGVGVGVTSPSAALHLKAGSNVSGTAPLKFTSGATMSTPEDGAVEFATNNYFGTVGSTRYVFAKTLTTTSVLDFPDTMANESSDLTIALTGAALGDVVSLGVPHSSVPITGSFMAWVSSANVVSVRYINNDGVTNHDPASGTFRISLTKY